MQKLCLLLLTLLISTFVYSQTTFQIEGNVTAEDDSPLLYGDVILMNGNDSIPIAHTIIASGAFSFKEMVEGAYLINISCLGYEKVYHSFVLNKDEEINFQLVENVGNLQEATVTATRNTITHEHGNIKIGIVNSMFANQPSTMDMLSQLPTVMMAPNGSGLSVIGKGAPLIYLENQRITLDDLIAIPLESIKSIEIINNPSARYEANGRAVLLIRRLKNLSDGYKIQLTETAIFSRNFNNNASVNANLKKNRLELRTNFAYNDLVLWESYESVTSVPFRDLSLGEQALSTGSRPQYIWSGGLHFQMNEKEYVSAYVYNRMFTDNASLEAETEVVDTSSFSQIKTLSDDSSDRKFFSSNINYNKQLRDGNLFLGAQYSNYGRNLISAISNNFDDTEFLLTQNRFQDFTIDAFSGRVDVEKKVLNGINVELGLNYYLADARAVSDTKFADNGQEDSFVYDYKERNLAAYTQFTGDLKKVNYSFGLRTETIDVEGQFKKDDQPLINRNKTVFFPRLRLTFPIDSTNSLTLNYTKTITRPNYLNTSSISTYISPYIEYTRNVNLQSSITQEVSLSWQHKNQAINVRLFQRDDPVNVIKFYQPDLNRIQQMPDNFDKEIGGSIQLVSPFNYKIWRVTNVVALMYNKTTDSRVEELSTAPYPYLYINNNFKLSSSMNAGFSFFWIGKRKTGASEMEPISSFNASFSKTFFQKLTFSIQLNDLFRAMEWTSRSIMNDVITNSTNFSDVKRLSFTLRYSFGKILKSNYKNKDVDEQLDRMR